MMASSMAALILAVLLFIYVLFLVAKKRLQLKYSLLWLLLSLAMAIGAVFPRVAPFFSHLLGFGLTSNFVLFMGVFCLFLICLSLSCVVSHDRQEIKTLTQRLGLLEKRVRELEGERDDEVQERHER